MADNTTLPGTGDVIADHERTINSVTVKVQRIVPLGGTVLATAQVTPTASAAQLIAAHDRRSSVVIYNGTNMTVFVGPATVTTANGFAMPPGSGLTVTSTVLIQLIVASVTGLTGVVYTLDNHD